MCSLPQLLGRCLLVLSAASFTACSAQESGTGEQADQAIVWTYASVASQPEAWNGLDVLLDDMELTLNGDASLKVVPRYSLGELRWPPYLVYSTPGEQLQGAESVTIRFWAKSDSPARLSLRVTNENASHLSATKSFELGSDWRPIEYTAAMTDTVTGKWPSVPRLILSQYSSRDAVYLGPLSVEVSRAVDEGPQEPPEDSIEALDGWGTADTENLYVQEGSALDFTTFVQASPAGAHGRVIANEKGLLAFEDDPEVPVRFLSLQWIPRFPPGFRNWSDQQIEAFAIAIARQGYNMVRFHFLDDYLSGNHRAAALKQVDMASFTLAQTPEELHWDEQALDRTYYLLAQLKQQGIYWNFDLMTTYVGNGNDQFILKGSAASLENAPINTKVQMFVNPEFRNNWKAAAQKLLTQVNPYTQLAPRDDPALVVVTCLNEQEILLPHREYGSELDEPWHHFLESKYGDYASLYAAWGGVCGEVQLAESGHIADVPSINEVAMTDTPAGVDMARFVGQLEYEMSEFYLSFLAEIGYEGLATNWNMRTRIGSVPARSLFSVISMNQYHAHPRGSGLSAWVSQDSALASGGNSFKGQVMARFLDRPFINTEFGHLFWNRYRHEQGLLHGAGAAFQEWGALTRHGNQVVETGEPMSHFNAGSDPISRAAEVQAALLFRRGDVAASAHTIEIPLTDEYIYSDGRALQALDDELARVWALSRIGISYGPKRADVPVDLTVLPGATAEITGDQMFSTVQDATSRERLEALVNEMRLRGILDQGNRTDPAAGLYESDTGELLVKTVNGGEMEVDTPRFVGAILKFESPLQVGGLTISRCTQPASISLASVDPDLGRTVGTARRLLLVVATDAINSGMAFKTNKHERVTALGNLPILIQTTDLKLTLDLDEPWHSYRAYALRLDGSRSQELPVDVVGQQLVFAVNTAELAPMNGTPFFEIVRDDWEGAN